MRKQAGKVQAFAVTSHPVYYILCIRHDRLLVLHGLIFAYQCTVGNVKCIAELKCIADALSILNRLFVLPRLLK